MNKNMIWLCVILGVSLGAFNPLAGTVGVMAGIAAGVILR